MNRAAFLLLLGTTGCQCAGGQEAAPETQSPAKAPEPTWPALADDAEQARQQIMDRVEKTKNPVVVIDLADQTLMDSGPRIYRIFLEVMYESKRKPLMDKVVRSLELERPLRSPEDYLNYLGIKEGEDLHKLVQRRLKERISSDAYLSDDEQRTGSNEYLNALHKAGAHLVYLSEHSFLRSGVGLARALRVNGYPALGARAHLMMRAMQESDEKLAYREGLATAARLGDVAAVIAKDPASLASQFPKAYSVCITPPDDPVQKGCWDSWASPSSTGTEDMGVAVDTERPPTAATEPAASDAGP